MEVQKKCLFREKTLHLQEGHMYKFERYRQLGLADFNQPVGLKMNLAKCKKCTAKKICKAIKQQLQYVCRDFGYVEWMQDEGAELSANNASDTKCSGQFTNNRSTCMRTKYTPFQTAS